MAFDIKKDPSKIIIAGTGDGWQLIPRVTDRVVYCLNDFVFYERYKIKPDILFILDILDEKPQIVSGSTNLGDVVKRINDMGCPLIAPFKYEEIPNSHAFPLERCVREFGQPYFLNTIGYMIAYALLAFTDQVRAEQQIKTEEPVLLSGKELALYGVNQASSSEYFYEKAAVEYWLGIANGRGVKITINGERSELLTNKARLGGNLLYGYNGTYEAIKQGQQKFGSQIVKRLSGPPKQFSRVVRKIYNT